MNKVKYACSYGTPVWGRSGLAVFCGECETVFAELG